MDMKNVVYLNRRWGWSGADYRHKAIRNKLVLNLDLTVHLAWLADCAWAVTNWLILRKHHLDLLVEPHCLQICWYLSGTHLAEPYALIVKPKEKLLQWTRNCVIVEHVARNIASCPLSSPMHWRRFCFNVLCSTIIVCFCSSV